jgi:uncharacterized protein
VLFKPVVEEISFAHGSDRLVGDLARPPWPGPHPAVVFVEGSGPGGRDLGDWPTRLAAAGFASLAYDKPGCGASTGDWTRQSLHDRAAETIAAVVTIRALSDIRSDAVALIGGSQGGWVAHIAGSQSDAVTAIVTVSGPGVGVLAQERYRLRRQLAADGFDDQDAENALMLLTEQVERVGAGEDPAAVHIAQAAWRGAGWYHLLAGTTPESIAFLAGIADYDPAAALAGLICPMLAVFGDDDLQVPVADSVRAIDSTLTEAGHDDYTIVVFPRAGHDLRLGTGERAPGFDELVVTWLQRRMLINWPAKTGRARSQP